MLNRRGGLFGCDRAAGVPWREHGRDADPGIRDGRFGDRGGAGAGGGLWREHLGGRFGGAIAEILYAGGRQLPDQQAGSGPMHLRAAGPDARSAVFEAGSDPVPQRADLSRPGAAAEADDGFPLCDQAERVSDARQRGDDRAVFRLVCHRGQAAQGVREEAGDGSRRHDVWGGARRGAGRGCQKAGRRAARDGIVEE